jgi:hydroxymethylpyrimidine pyrophosphatase-like HAD family hydrolase
MAMFCTDIDGTLLNPERTLSLRTIEAVRAIRAAGHAFVLCSSRMPESMRILERLYDGADEPLIAYIGGLPFRCGCARCCDRTRVRSDDR